MSDASTQLLYAILANDVANVRALVQTSRIFVSPEDAWMIFEACLRGPDMISALASAGNIDMNPELPGRRGDRVLHLLLYTPPGTFGHDKMSIIRELLRTGIDPFLPDRNGNTAIHILSGGSRIEPLSEEHRLLEILLFGGLPSAQSNPIVNNQNACGNTALFIAANFNNLPQLDLLLRNGADANIVGESGWTALSIAIVQDFVAAAELLLRFGAEIPEDVEPKGRPMRRVLNRSRD